MTTLKKCILLSDFFCILYKTFRQLNGDKTLFLGVKYSESDCGHFRMNYACVGIQYVKINFTIIIIWINILHLFNFRMIPDNLQGLISNYVRIIEV